MGKPDAVKLTASGITFHCGKGLLTAGYRAEHQPSDGVSYTWQLLRVNNLTQSVLAKAFRGELTADWRAANPALISGENSAEALLERIKAEREAVALASKAAKKKPAKKPRAKKAKA